MQGLLEFAKTLGAPRIAAMVAVTLALVGFFAFLILRVSSPQMTPLFTDLSYEDSSAIVKVLERQGIGYELRNDEQPNLVDVFRNLSQRFDGAYNLAFMNAMGDMVIARDPKGFRPLCYAREGPLFAAATVVWLTWKSSGGPTF